MFSCLRSAFFETTLTQLGGSFVPRRSGVEWKIMKCTLVEFEMSAKRVDFKKANSAFIEEENEQRDEKFLSVGGKRQLSCPAQILAASNNNCQGEFTIRARENNYVENFF